jgi:hypothetical protein
MPDEVWVTSDAETEVEVEPDSELLFRIAVAYQGAQALLMSRTQAQTREAWGQQHPVSDSELSHWVATWDALLGNAARQQAQLTKTYSRMLLRAFGAKPAALPELNVTEALREAERWLGSAHATIDMGLLREAEAAVGRMRQSRATLEDLARADRLPWLHSPVIQVRTGLKEGSPLADVHESVEASLDSMTDATLRSVEADAVESVGWPRFKNGKAMLAKRVPQVGACGWCRVVSTRMYPIASKERSAAWHAHCRCSWTLLSFSEARAYSAELSKSGDYFSAAKTIGAWDGEIGPSATASVIEERAQVLRPDPGPQS